ncbi:MAG: hypothetical protein LLF96_11060 [Eubacteriales bacterium]|nr:hypothetical protein [Eubacteriales bacterium]
MAHFPPMPEDPQGHFDVRHGRRHGRAGRFFRGYLMVAGALATAYLLERLLVLLFIELGKWL